MSAALDEIRRLYFETKKASILDDFDKAIDLLKSIETPEERQKATVYMSGLAEMRKEWGVKGVGDKSRSTTGRGPAGRTGKPRPKKKPSPPSGT